MDSDPAQVTSDRYSRVAGSIHTILTLVILGGWAFWGKMTADRMREAANPHRVRLYVITLVFEWLVFVFVVAGVRRSGVSVLVILGDRWRSFRQVMRDIGIGVAFWLVSTGLLFIFSRLLRIDPQGRNMQFILPHGGVEIALWLALSITAGICEETIFRGYLQRQFMAFSHNVPVGILLSAVTFGAAHAYQGFRMVTLISLYGAMFGILAHWRGTVRPGMIVHAWQDSLGGIMGALTRH